MEAATTTRRKAKSAAALSKADVPEDEDEPENEAVVDDSAGDDDAAEQARQEAEADLDKLDPDSNPDPLLEPKIYIIGKPPEMGGENNEYSVYTQRSMGYVQMLRWTALVSKNIAEAIKAGGAVDLGEAFSSSTGSATERAKQVIENSFNDAGSFAALFFQLIAYSPDLLLETYCFALDVPNGERRWAKRVMDQRWDPENEQYGLQSSDGREILERFVDQNYEEMRDFFVDLFSSLVARVRANERRHKDRKSGSGQSK